MEKKKNTKNNSANTENTSIKGKRKYEAPEIFFVPLQLEERLLGCDIGSYQGGGCSCYIFS